MAHASNSTTVRGKAKLNKDDVKKLPDRRLQSLAEFWVMLLYRDDSRDPWDVIQVCAIIIRKHNLHLVEANTLIVFSCPSFVLP